MYVPFSLSTFGQASSHLHGGLGRGGGAGPAPRRGSVMGAVHKAEDVAVKKVAKSKGFGMMMSMVDSIN